MNKHINNSTCGHSLYSQKGQDWTVQGHGLEQSPIDIIVDASQPSDDAMKMELFLTDHTLAGLKVDETAYSLKVNGSFSKLRATDVDGHVYEFEAIQFHFHAPAEHTINGHQYDLELHIVHQMTPQSASTAKTNRNLAVVGVFFNLDEDSQATPNSFIEALKLHNVGTDIHLNMNELLKNDLTDKMTYYAYKGSLTTPPCSENANWYVVEKPLTITKDQLDQFNLRWKDNMNFAGGYGNNRPVQPLNGRVVMKSTNCCVMARSKESQMIVSEEMRALPTLRLNIIRDALNDDILGNQGHLGTPTISRKDQRLLTLTEKRIKDFYASSPRSIGSPTPVRKEQRHSTVIGKKASKFYAASTQTVE